MFWGPPENRPKQPKTAWKPPKLLWNEGGGSNIPDICHFFYTGKISENKIYTEKRVHKRCQLSNYYTEKYQFCVHSGKIYTGQKKFTPAPPVVPVTNIRYDWAPPFFFILTTSIVDPRDPTLPINLSICHKFVKGWQFYDYWHKYVSTICVNYMCHKNQFMYTIYLLSFSF